jgi:hypothetical protein
MLAWQNSMTDLVRGAEHTSNRAAALRVEAQKKHELWTMAVDFVRTPIGFAAGIPRSRRPFNEVCK